MGEPSCILGTVVTLRSVMGGFRGLAAPPFPYLKGCNWDLDSDLSATGESPDFRTCPYTAPIQ